MFSSYYRSFSTCSKLQATWSSSEVLTLHKSKFRGWCTPITASSDIKSLVEELYSLDHKLSKASHPAMLAWKTVNPQTSFPTSKKTKKKTTPKKDISNAIPDPSIYSMKTLTGLNQGFNDNNEGGSGMRLMGLLDRIKMVNILVVVARWYGGTPLGPARFKCISDVAYQAIQSAGYLDVKGIESGWIDVNKVASMKLKK